MATKKIEIIYDINGKAIDVAIESTLNLKQQVRELTKELNKTGKSAEEIAVLSNKLNETKDSVAKVNAQSREFFSTLSLLPGPIGAFSNQIDNSIGLLKTFSSFKLSDIKNQLKELIADFGGIISNIGKATGISKVYTTINTALAQSFVAVGVGETAAAAGARAFAAALTATGIGAIIVALGYLISKIIDWVSSTEEADAANQRLNETLKEQQRILALDLDAIDASNKANIARAKIAGQTEQEINGIAKKGGEERLALLVKAQNDMLAEQDKFRKKEGDYAQLTNEQRLKKQEELKEGLQKADGAVMNQINANNQAQLDAQVQQAEKSRQKAQQAADKKRQIEKENHDKIVADTKTYYDKLLEAQDEFELLLATSEGEAEIIKIDQKRKREIAEINAFKISEEKKVALIAKINTNAEYKNGVVVAELRQKIRLKSLENQNDVLKVENDLLRKGIEIRIEMIKDEQQRTEASLKFKASQEITAVQQSIASAKIKAETIKDIEDKLAFDLVKLKDDTKKKEAQINLEKLDNDLKFLQTRQQGIQEGTIAFYDSQEEILNKSKERELAALDLTEAQKVDIEKKYAKLSSDLQKEKFNTYLGYVSAGLSAVSSFYSQQQTINGLAMNNELDAVKGNAEAQDKIKEKYFYKNRDAQVGQAIISTLQSAISAYSSLAVIPVVGPVLGAIAAAAALAFGYKQVSLIKAQNYQSSLPNASGAAAPPISNLGKNYGDGGLIGGKRHAQGGTMINAEAGEAVMTRGAVTMFAPLLSMMNQAGGGTSFSTNMMTTSTDAPKSAYPTGIDQSPIFKTYVVSNELTSEAQKQARLKDLSTL